MGDEGIKQTVTGFFEESPGNKSSARLIFVIGMLWLFVIISLVIFLKAFHNLEVSWTEMTIFFGGTASVLSGTKVMQKNIEK